MYFKFKDQSVRPQRMYFGGHVWKDDLLNRATAWDLRLSQYFHAEVNNEDKYLKERGLLPKRAETPIRNLYHPKINITEELGHVDATYYH